ncbi:helicase-exonuclease AddAB subunit AddA [Lysinibacillus varians]|uniref:ATP-dependent helicase/nuclease subunit A n=1 Tax=Lysinibacillus varians TaxID=1145276 RepID=A0ABY2TED3_9BACI|nr:helicase-exonuclease AddAB subunit AddA [Lysinibacillus varians]AHN20611.1 ATP-dependent helicase [Lysinibacillus varians]TKI66923.1 helicase-exonuclease AddAB subunit AddA [Lysinibacillus varians]
MVQQIPVKPANVTWTDDQWKAIYASGQDTLVSAAAGSGKTAVLINRMIEKVVATENPMNVDELLVVTFTNASAAEMRHRMAEALEKAIAANPTSSHLRRQLSLVNKAQISTLHSFCLAIVKQYAYLLDIDPGFRIANEAEIALLRDDILADVLESAYDTDDEARIHAIYQLVDSFTSDRDDQAIETLISKLYDTSRVHAEPQKWLTSLPESYQLADDVTIDDLDLSKYVKLTLKHSLEEAFVLISEMRAITLQPDGPAPYAETAEIDFAMIQEGIRISQEGTWQQLFDYFSTVKWSTLKRVSKDALVDLELQELAKKKREAAKKIMNKLKDTYFVRTPARLLEEIRLMAPTIATLVDLTSIFSQQFRLAKLERGIIDFSDLEHYALQILTEEVEGELQPSPVALDLQRRFKEVLVDEYQDTNMLQETILQLVKLGDEHDGNLFMVGDVKQSIYRFRLAEPKLFMRKYGEFVENPDTTGMRIDLNANFRSRSEVLNATNFVFAQIMDERVGEIQYDDNASLKPAAPYDAKEVPVELVILHPPEEEAADEEMEESITEASELEELKKSQYEARFIIDRIRQLMEEGTTVYDTKTKTERPLKYSDIVILMRSMTWSTDLVEEFKLAGIPLYAESSKGYFDALEVMIMLNTLKVVDNPYQDIPLASVLRAPFVGLTENELAKIRLADTKTPFYDALRQFIRSEGHGVQSETFEKLQRFMLAFENWRDLARRGSLSDLIWKIYLDTHYYEMVGAMPNGKQRQANLRILHDRALMYEKTAFRGLFRFLRFIDRMRTRGDDLGTAKSIGEKDDVVRLVTIHSSKGLEYPVVFVAGMGRPFNKMDFHNPYLFDQDYGLAVKAIDPENRITYTSLPFLAMKEKKELEMRAEEMRVLYVAMTRAKERLILIGSVKNWDKTLDSWLDAQNLPVDAPLQDYLRARANSYFDWVGPAVARHADFAAITSTSYKARQDLSHWWVRAISTHHFMYETQALDEDVQQMFTTPEDAALLAEITARFQAQYAYQKSTQKRSKTSVSEIKRLESLQRLEEPEYYFTAPKKNKGTIAPRPTFLQDKQLTGAEMGTAIHTVMQHVPQCGFSTVQEVEQFVTELVVKQLLTEAESKIVPCEKIYRFFTTDIGQRFKNAKQIRREMPFTISCVDEDGDAQIVQGIVDCLFEDVYGHWILLDYKTDRIGRQFAEEPALSKELLGRYGVQLRVYSEALESILHIQVYEKVLYLFDIEQAIYA